MKHSGVTEQINQEQINKPFFHILIYHCYQERKKKTEYNMKRGYCDEDGGDIWWLNDKDISNILKVTNLLSVTFIYQILISWWNVGPDDFHK